MFFAGKLAVKLILFVYLHHHQISSNYEYFKIYSEHGAQDSR